MVSALAIRALFAAPSDLPKDWDIKWLVKATVAPRVFKWHTSGWMQYPIPFYPYVYSRAELLETIKNVRSNFEPCLIKQPHLPYTLTRCRQIILYQNAHALRAIVDVNLWFARPFYLGLMDFQKSAYGYDLFDVNIEWASYGVKGFFDNIEEALSGRVYLLDAAYQEVPYYQCHSQHVAWDCVTDRYGGYYHYCTSRKIEYFDCPLCKRVIHSLLPCADYLD